MRCALVCAAWARYAEGRDEQGEPIVVVDRSLEQVRAAASRPRDEPTSFLLLPGVFGDLAQEAVFVQAFTTQLRALHADGTGDPA